jgi:protein SCO1/2
MMAARVFAHAIAASTVAFALATGAACDGGPRKSGNESGTPSGTFSVYDLGSTWHDQFATSRTLASLRGKPQVLALVYTNCTSTCPLTVSAMQEVEAKAGERAGFVLVSLDPARDSPARLAEFAKQRGLSAKWTLLSGDEKSVRELAAVLGVKYRTVSPTEIVHTSTLTILDADGRMVAQYSETDAVDRAVGALQRFNR